MVKYNIIIMIDIFKYLADFVAKDKLYYTIYILLIPLTSFIYNIVLPESIGKFYSTFKSTYLYYIVGSLIIFYYLHIFINWLAWRVIPQFY